MKNRFKGNAPAVFGKDFQKAQRAFMNYPGESGGLKLDEVRRQYSECNKIFSQTVSANAGATNDVVVNLPAGARYLVGISYYSNFDSSAENPLFTYTLNNTELITKTPVRQILIPNLQSQVFYPINLPLTGQDQHILDLESYGNAKKVSFIFHYI